MQGCELDENNFINKAFIIKDKAKDMTFMVKGQGQGHSIIIDFQGFI